MEQDQAIDPIARASVKDLQVLRREMVELSREIDGSMRELAATVKAMVAETATMIASLKQEAAAYVAVENDKITELRKVLERRVSENEATFIDLTNRRIDAKRELEAAQVKRSEAEQFYTETTKQCEAMLSAARTSQAQVELKQKDLAEKEALLNNERRDVAELRERLNERLEGLRI